MEKRRRNRTERVRKCREERKERCWRRLDEMENRGLWRRGREWTVRRRKCREGNGGMLGESGDEMKGWE